MNRQQAKKVNCWEHTRCGRELGGSNEALDVCPASIAKDLNRTHGGLHAGQSCWVIAGTMCGGIPQGTFAQKYKNCEKCAFYQKVRTEEGPQFELAIVLINRAGGIRFSSIQQTAAKA